MSKRYGSDAMAAIHETMSALQDAGAIDKRTMRRFDEACLTPIRPLKPKEIKAKRLGGRGVSAPAAIGVTGFRT